MCKYSFIVPAYNEEKSLHLFYDAVTPVFDGLGETYELIFVNDGSRDATKRILDELAEKDARVKVCHFSRNFGQQAALLCGLEKSQGEAVIAMDADLQDPPSVAVQMIEKWKEGFDIVHGKRRQREGESFFKKATAAFFYKFTKKITGLQVMQSSGDFKLYDRKVVDVIVSLSEQDRLLRVQTAWVGFSQTCVEFDRPERVAGESHYTLKKMINLAKAGILPNTEYTLTLPIKLAILLGVLSVAGFITMIVLSCCNIYFGGLTAWLFPSLGCATALILLSQGLANMHTSMIYKEVQNRPKYIISEQKNFDK
jgi:dolichol-phosphate mannosyltransferase